jgi:hypothetical protein
MALFLASLALGSAAFAPLAYANQFTEPPTLWDFWTALNIILPLDSWVMRGINATYLNASLCRNINATGPYWIECSFNGTSSGGSSSGEPNSTIAFYNFTGGNFTVGTNSTMKAYVDSRPTGTTINPSNNNALVFTNTTGKAVAYNDSMSYNNISRQFNIRSNITGGKTTGVQENQYPTAFCLQNQSGQCIVTITKTLLTSGSNKLNLTCLNIMPPDSGPSYLGLNAFSVCSGQDKSNPSSTAMYIGDLSYVTERIHIMGNPWAVNWGGTQGFESFPPLVTMSAASEGGVTSSVLRSANGYRLKLYSDGWGWLPIIPAATIDGHRDVEFTSYYDDADTHHGKASAYVFDTQQTSAGLGSAAHTIWTTNNGNTVIGNLTPAGGLWLGGGLNVTSNISLSNGWTLQNESNGNLTFFNATRNVVLKLTQQGLMFVRAVYGMSPLKLEDVQATSIRSTGAVTSQVSGSTAANFTCSGRSDCQLFVKNDNIQAQIIADTTTGTAVFGDSTSHPLSWRVNNNEKMRLLTSGRLLIGTTVDNGRSVNLQLNDGLETKSLFTNIRKVNGDINVDVTDSTILINNSLADININLFSCTSEKKGWNGWFKAIDTLGKKVYIVPSGSETIDNILTDELTATNQSQHIQCDGLGGWWKVSGFQ